MKNKSLLLLLFTVVTGGMLKAQCKIDSIISLNYIKGTGAKDPYNYYKYIYNSKDSLVGIYSYAWEISKSKWNPTGKEDYILDANGNRKQVFAEAVIFNKWAKQYRMDITLDANGKEGTYMTYLWDSAANDYLLSSRYILVYNANKKVTQSVQQFWNSGNSSWDNNSRYDLIYDGTGFIKGQLSYQWNNDSAKWLNYYKIDYRRHASGAPLSYSFFRWQCGTGGCQWEFSDSVKFFLDQLNRDTANYRHTDTEIIQRTLTAYNINGCVDKFIYYYQDNITRELYLGSEDQYYYRSKNSAIESNETKAFSFYPNPAGTELHVNNVNGVLNILDPVTGKVLVSQTVENGRTVINTSQLVSGVYLLFVNNQYYKFIVQH